MVDSNLNEIDNLYNYIASNFDNFLSINTDSKIMKVIFYKGFEMKITFSGYYKIYFNEMYYYDIDKQDIIDTINEIFNDKYVYCNKNNIIKIIDYSKYKSDNKFKEVWTIKNRIK